MFGDCDRNVQKEGDGLVGGNKRLLIVLNDERESRRTDECRARRARVLTTDQGLSCLLNVRRSLLPTCKRCMWWNFQTYGSNIWGSLIYMSSTCMKYSHLRLRSHMK